MALLGFLGISEGLEILLLLLVLLLLALFVTRRILFSLRLRRVRKENMELARHMKKKLKSARFRSSSDFDEEDDGMFRPSIRAKVPVMPATYEARLTKIRKGNAKRRPRQAVKSPKASADAFKPESKPKNVRKAKAQRKAKGAR